MKRILMVTEPFYGGIFAYVSQLCNLLCDEFEIYWAYTMHPKTPGNYQQLIDSRVHLIEIELTRKLMNVKDVISSIRVLREIEKEVQPDLIHLHSSIAGGLGRIAFSGKRCPIVYTPHAYSFVVMGNNTLKCKVYRFVEMVLGKTNCTTLTCCESEDEVAKKLGNRTAYIETGIDLSDFEREIEAIPVSKRDGITVYTISRACEQKRPKLFNEIAGLVPEANFLWIGDGDQLDALTAPNICKPGWKPREEALAMAKGADIFLLCSYGEAIAMSLLENMYLKKLCIVSDTMGNRSVIHDGVNGFVCKTAQEYATRIKEVMQSFPANLPEKAKEDVETIYTLANMKEKYVQFYNKMMNSTRGK